MFLSVVLPFSSRFWLLALCFGCFCAEGKTSADSRLGFANVEFNSLNSVEFNSVRCQYSQLKNNNLLKFMYH